MENLEFILLNMSINYAQNENVISPKIEISIKRGLII